MKHVFQSIQDSKEKMLTIKDKKLKELEAKSKVKSKAKDFTSRRKSKSEPKSSRVLLNPFKFLLILCRCFAQVEARIHKITLIFPKRLTQP